MINLDQIIDQAISNNVNAQTAIASVTAATEQADLAAKYANSTALNTQLVENKALEVANNRAVIEADVAIVAAELAEIDRLVDLAITAKTLAEQYRDDALGFLSLNSDLLEHSYIFFSSHSLFTSPFCTSRQPHFTLTFSLVFSADSCHCLSPIHCLS